MYHPPNVSLMAKNRPNLANFLTFGEVAGP